MLVDNTAQNASSSSNSSGEASGSSSRGTAAESDGHEERGQAGAVDRENEAGLHDQSGVKESKEGIVRDIEELS